MCTCQHSGSCQPDLCAFLQTFHNYGCVLVLSCESCAILHVETLQLKDSACAGMQGSTSLAAVVQWLRLTAAQPTIMANPCHPTSKRARQHSRRQQSAARQTDHASSTALHATDNAIHPSQQQLQHQLPGLGKQEAETACQLVRQAADSASGCLKQEADTDSGLLKQETDSAFQSATSLQPSAAAAGASSSTEAATAPEVNEAASAGASRQAAASSRGSSVLGMTSQQEWACMDCLSQLRDIMFAELPLQSAVEVPLLDAGAMGGS